jgi:hypothetical protein
MKADPLQDILYINAHLKFVEHLLHVFDTAEDSKTLKDVRAEFHHRFGSTGHLLDQYFGVYRLLPLLLMKEVNKNAGKPLEGVYKQMKTVRDAVAHNKFSISESGYKFGDMTIAFSDFQVWLHKLENKFYRENARNDT